MNESVEPVEFYTPKTDQELKIIAKDIVENKVFCSWHLMREDDIDSYVSDIRLVFLPLVFAGQEFYDGMKKHKISFLYEYLNEAGPRSINGMPSFMSMQFLSLDDEKRLADFCREYHEFVKQWSDVSPQKTGG